MSPDSVRIVHVGVEALPDTLVVIDAGRRTYLGLSRDRTYWHSIRPARAEDPVVRDEVRQVGELVCSCAGGAYGRACYWTQLATALETGDRGFVIAQSEQAEVVPEWIQRAASGELQEVIGR